MSADGWICAHCNSPQTGHICVECGSDKPYVYESDFIPGNDENWPDRPRNQLAVRMYGAIFLAAILIFLTMMFLGGRQ